MIDKHREKDDEILRAVTVLEDADITESEADAAFQVLARRLPKQSPRAGFAARVMYAVRQAPLPAGRVALRARPSLPLVLSMARRLRLSPDSRQASASLAGARSAKAGGPTPATERRPTFALLRSMARVALFTFGPATSRRLLVPALLVGAAAIAGIAALWVAFLLAPVTLPIVARVFTFAVQACLLFIPPLTAGLDVWAVISTAAGAITQAATSAEMLSVLAGITSVGVLSFGALTRLVSSRAAEPQ